jgi:hypothetical protein
LAVGPDDAVEGEEDDKEEREDIGDYGEGRCEGTNPLAPISKLALLILKVRREARSYGVVSQGTRTKKLFWLLKQLPRFRLLDKRIAF